MVAMGFLSCRSESLGLCGRTDATNAIPVAFGERSGPFDAGTSRLRKLRARGRVQRVVTRMLVTVPTDSASQIPNNSAQVSAGVYANTVARGIVYTKR